jgi:hypothetical protein
MAASFPGSGSIGVSMRGAGNVAVTRR